MGSLGEGFCVLLATMRILRSTLIKRSHLSVVYAVLQELLAPSSTLDLSRFAVVLTPDSIDKDVPKQTLRSICIGLRVRTQGDTYPKFISQEIQLRRSMMQGHLTSITSGQPKNDKTRTTLAQISSVRFLRENALVVSCARKGVQAAEDRSQAFLLVVDVAHATHTAIRRAESAESSAPSGHSGD